MMTLRSLLLGLTLALFAPSLHADAWEHITGYFKEKNRPEPPSIRILLVHDAKEVKLEVRGKYSLFDPYTDTYLSKRLAGKSRYIQALGDGLRWGESFPGLYQIKIKPDNAETTILVNNREYEGLIYVYDIGGTVSVVNQIGVESYTRSVLNAYEHLDLEKEALAALAIAVRTHAYFQAVNPKNTYWAVDAEKMGYQGLMPVSPAIEEAMKQTRYMIASRTGLYEGIATPFAAQFEGPEGHSKGSGTSKISLEEANALAKKGEHAAQILAKAFPGSTIMLMPY